MASKKSYEMAVKKSVSMPEILFDDGDGRRRELRLSTFSDYVQWLIRRDTNGEQHDTDPLSA